MRVYRDKDGYIWIEGTGGGTRVISDVESNLNGAPLHPGTRERFQLVELVESPAPPKLRKLACIVGSDGWFVVRPLNGGYLASDGKSRTDSDAPFAAFSHRHAAVMFAEKHGYEVDCEGAS